MLAFCCNKFEFCDLYSEVLIMKDSFQGFVFFSFNTFINLVLTLDFFFFKDQLGLRHLFLIICISKVHILFR